MDLTANIYKQAAVEHIDTAGKLHNDLKHYVLAHYIAGLAVESMFRAYRFRINSEFNSRHNLYRLFRLSQFDRIVPSGQREEFDAALATVVSQWSNTQRYCSEAALRSFFLSAGLNRRKIGEPQWIKGDFVKERSRLMIEASLLIVTIGAKQWKNLSIR